MTPQQTPPSPSSDSSTVSTVPTSTIHRLTARVDALTEKAKRPLIHAWIPPPPPALPSSSSPSPSPVLRRKKKEQKEQKKEEEKRRRRWRKRTSVRARPRCRGVLLVSRRQSGRKDGYGGGDDDVGGGGGGGGEWESLDSDDAGDGDESLSEISWGPDSPLTAALRRHRAAFLAPPSSPPSPISSGSTGFTRAEEELRELEEQVKHEIARRGALVRRLLTSSRRNRGGHGRRGRPRQKCR